jgi:thiol-disulfide isomerase/thioredoxin
MTLLKSNILIIVLHYIVMLCAVMINSIGYAQGNRPTVYIDLASKKSYSQVQFDSLKSANSMDISKKIVLMGRKEKDKSFEISFHIVTIKPIASVRHNWLNKRIPDFKLTDITGNIFDNSVLKDKIVVINLWSTTCAPCIDEMPDLNKLVEKYNHKNVVFLAITPERTELIFKLLVKNSFKYTIIPDGKALFDAMDVPGYPYHIVLDGKGIIRFIQSGTINSKIGRKIAETELPEAIECELK